jgi:hypothetical protein
MKLKDLLKPDPFPNSSDFRSKFQLYHKILEFDHESIIEFALNHPKEYNEIQDLVPLLSQEILLINKL